ncbi:tetratricopeptide repeat protein, partial [Streptomyces sp. NPDC090085]|uniref:tetratricopeptide repeat protein n=1 Tax=Streptomyces sp. NPDC090085 TaxID=3365943 RepID=UPI00381D74C8
MKPNPQHAAHTSITGGTQDNVLTIGTVKGSLTISTTGVQVPAYLQDPQRWALVEAWDAMTAGTHRARPDAAGSAVPAYVTRDVDEELQVRLMQAVQHGGLVLVLGESTAGKTRAAHHAVRSCKALSGYRVLTPNNGPDLVIAVDVVAATAVRCVVWLDDLERFLTPDGLEGGVLAELVRLKTPVLATMQLRHFDTYTESDHDDASNLRTSGTGARVLKQVEPLYLPRRWSGEELARAGHCDDLRVIDAIRHHGTYGVAEYLAAGPALLSAWRHASRPDGHPRGAALVSAAVDLSRTGLRPPYPTALLTTLHQHYLPNDPLLRPEPIDKAFEWAARRRQGATSLLLPSNDPDAYGVFDYLPDHTIRPVTEHAWHSALDHSTDDEERLTIGVHAYATAPHITEAAWRPLARRNTSVAVNLGVLLAKTKRTKEAEEMFLQAAAAGDNNAAVNLGVLLAETGRLEEAEEMFLQAAAVGDTDVSSNLGVLLAKTGRLNEAEALLREAATRGNTDASVNLGALLIEANRSEEAEEAYRQAAAAGNIDAIRALGTLLVSADRLREAEPLLRQAAATGDIDATANLGTLLIKAERLKEAEPLLRQAAAAGDTNAAANLGALLMRTGRSEEGERVLRRAAATDDTNATGNLGALLLDGERLEEAE